MDYSQLTDRELERRYRETLDQRERTALRRELNTRMRQAYIKEIDSPPSERVNQTSTNKTLASGLDWRMATPKHSTNIQIWIIFITLFLLALAVFPIIFLIDDRKGW